MQHPRTLELILSACYPPDCVLTAGCRHTRLTEHLLDRPAELQMLVCVCVWLIRLCVGFYKRKMDWLKKKKEKEMYVWARKRENDMLMSAYCMNKRAGNVCMYVWNANVSALSVFLFVCAHELTDDDIQYRTAAHVIIGPRSAYICFDKAVANMHSFKPKLCFIGSYKTVKSSQNKKGTIIIIMLLMIKQNSGSKKMK